MYGNDAFYKIVEDYNFSTVLDIGCGNGGHTLLFQEYDKKVTSISLQQVNNMDIIVGDYNSVDFKKQFDCIWACHVLEHQFNPNFFLKKMNNDLKENGLLCITVPPLKRSIVGGHYSLWNAGLLIYNLIMANFDCSNIRIKKYRYNISIILEKKAIELPSNLPADIGELEMLKDFAPDFFGQNFNGDIEEYNWN